jgi:multimeric flavodoxin WrbA
MKILVIQGSPRERGNTESVVDWAMAPAKAAGHGVEVVRTAELDIHGCTECFACQKETDKPGCGQKDAFASVLDKMLACDLVAWAMPVFCWGWPAQIKCVADRLYCTFKFESDPYRSLLEGKKMALIVTAGGDENDGADLCVATYDRLVEYARAVSKGRLVAGGLGDPEKTRGDVELAGKAGKFGASLLE